MNTISMIFFSNLLTKGFQIAFRIFDTMHAMDQTHIIPSLSSLEMTSSPRKMPPLYLPCSPQLVLHLKKTILAV